MKIVNTSSGKIDEFNTIEDKKINMYICVQQYIIMLTLVTCVQLLSSIWYIEISSRLLTIKSMLLNFIDEDYKIIKAAPEAGITEKELTDKYIKIYLDD